MSSPWRDRILGLMPRTAIVCHDLFMVWACWQLLHAGRYSILADAPALPLWNVDTTLVLALLANPNTVDSSIARFHWLPINLYINGDTIYYLLYALLGLIPLGLFVTGALMYLRKRRAKLQANARRSASKISTEASA